jgi:hypothetical protein
MKPTPASTSSHGSASQTLPHHGHRRAGASPFPVKKLAAL